MDSHSLIARDIPRKEVSLADRGGGWELIERVLREKKRLKPMVRVLTAAEVLARRFIKNTTISVPLTETEGSHRR